MDLTTTLPLRSGNRIPVVGLGTWELTDSTADTILAALDFGYPMIDTASDYGSQPGIGEGLCRSGIERGDLFLVAKVEETEDAYEATRRNLDEMQLDYADLVLIHRPPHSGTGEELWRGLIRARDDGLAKDIGVSNYAIAQIDALVDATGEVPAVNQIEWSPFGYSDEMLRYAWQHDIVIQAYSPLTRGKRLDNDRIARIAGKYGKSPAQILIRWNLQRGTVPIPKANRHEHLQENIDVFDFVISDEDMATLIELDEHYSSLGTLPYV